ncbi:uncharacterized protein LOC141646770 [Silene latifolia]|uniref:uncharacterized protein LOC141646770 n=1 Tax=Silene latifolia TaxID=37657 RepID=UPI003D77D5A5
MNASRFMDKQIMDLSRSSLADNNNNNPDLLDLMNPQVDQHNHNQGGINDGLLSMNKKKSEILPNYDFHPVNSIASSTVTRDWASLDDSNLPNLSSNRSYGSPNHVQLDKTEKAQAKAQKVDDSAILSEIDRTMKKHTETLMHAIDSLSARLSQMESRTRQIEHSVDELKVSVGNAHGSADGKLRQLENIIMEVQSGVQNVKDKQDVIEGHMLLAKLQISKAEQSSKPPNSVHQDPAQQAAAAAAAAAASAPPQQSGFQQLATAVPQSYASMGPPNAPPPSQQHNHPPGPHRDAYFPTPDSSSQQYQIPPPVQNQQPGPAAPQPQPQLQPHQYQPSPAPPYPQPPHSPQHPSIVGNSAPQYQPSSSPMGHRSDESPYVPPQTYPSNLYQPAAQPSGGPPPTQSYYGNTSPMYEPPPPARSSSSFPSSYAPPSGPSEQYPYGGPPSHYGGGPPVKPQPHSPRGGTGGYPQLPTARVLPSAIPTASGVSGGSSSGGGGNKVPIDDVVDRVTNMGFSRDQVRATVRRLTDNGQSVDLNVVLDKLMNDADVQPPKGWFGR